MARTPRSQPLYKKHPSRPTARCWVNGGWVYLGAFNSPESFEAFRRVCAQVSAHAATPTATPGRVTGKAVTVNELLLAFFEHVERFYVRPDGTPTNEVGEYRQCLRIVRRLYGIVPAADFGPAALKAVRAEMVRMGWCRSRTNKQTGRVKRCWKWGVSEEIIPADVWVALGSVEGLRRGRSEARETEPVKPVDETHYAATLPELTDTPRTMVQLQRAAGLRPGEVRLLVPADLDTSGDLWVYKPEQHKMSHLGRDKAVPLPPSARALIEPRLAGLGPNDYVFTPRQAREEMYADRRARRVSKVTPSQVCRRKPAGQLKKKWTPRFSAYSYAQWVARACKRAGVEPWTPGQLRHSFGTEVRERFGLEIAQVMMGHANAKTTEIYAEAAMQKAKAAAKELG